MGVGIKILHYTRSNSLILTQKNEEEEEEEVFALIWNTPYISDLKFQIN